MFSGHVSVCLNNVRPLNISIVINQGQSKLVRLCINLTVYITSNKYQLVMTLFLINIKISLVKSFKSITQFHHLRSI